MGFDGCKSIALEKVLINLMGVKTEPKSSFCMGVNCVFYDLIKMIKLLAMLFYFYPYKKLKAFSKVLNHCTFF